MNGISSEIVARANELGALSLRGEDLVAVCAKLCPDEMDELQEAVKPSEANSTLYTRNTNDLVQEMIARKFIAADFSKRYQLRDQLGRARNAESVLSDILDITNESTSNSTSNSS